MASIWSKKNARVLKRIRIILCTISNNKINNQLHLSLNHDEFRLLLSQLLWYDVVQSTNNRVSGKSVL